MLKYPHQLHAKYPILKYPHTFTEVKCGAAEIVHDLYNMYITI